MGKYTGLRGKLPEFKQEQGWQQEIDEAKRRLLGASPDQAASANLARLAAEYVKRRRRKDRLSRQEHTVNTEIEALSQLIVDRMETGGEERVDLRGGITVSIKDDIYPSVEDRSKVLAWIKHEGLESLLTVHYQTLKAMVGDRLAAGTTPPPGVKVFIKTAAKCRGLKLKGAENGDE